jgi:glycosyltransferase involved in cell wall biosynthesis
LSGDISKGIDQGQQTEIHDLLERVKKRPSILMVGTIEPRKGYAQALSAFEQLWKEGRDVNLVIVGKTGWKTEDLVLRLRKHPEAGKRLIWVENASDEILFAMYDAVNGLLMASEGEGFGLPIAEAAQFRKPILARNIPVFREVAEGNALYFTGTTGKDLAAAISAWFDLVQKGRAPFSDKIPLLGWPDSARQLTHCLLLK